LSCCGIAGLEDSTYGLLKWFKVGDSFTEWVFCNKVKVMADEFDPSDFVDSDYLAAQKAAQTAPSTSAQGITSRPPNREELEAKVNETQQRLLELKRAQEALERERVALEEARRRQSEYQIGRQETVQNLTRGLGILEEAEFKARQDAEQMAKILVGFRDALSKVQSISSDSWTTENYETELTRALTTIENARMEWNSARLKLPLLNGEAAVPERESAPPKTIEAFPIEKLDFPTLFRMGFAFSLPILIMAVIGLIVFAIAWFGQ
jgi:type II secretory pathway pseudopilin PulG